MMVDTKGLHVGVVYWTEGDGVAILIDSTLKELGCKTTGFLYDERLPETLDMIISYGPWGSLVPLANQLLSLSRAQRPAFVLWLSEQLPNPELPGWIQYLGGAVRSQAERLAYHRNGQGHWHLVPHLRWLTTKAYRFRYYGDLFWLKRQGILSALATTSSWTAQFLRARGFDPILAYEGAHPSWDPGVQVERDIPVLWIGKTATRRRACLLSRIRRELKERGVEMLVIDGVEHPYVFGQERTALLNRTKIVVNLLRKEWDDNSFRYYIAASSRALIVTEPTLPHTPFLPDVHLVQSPIEHMADTIIHYLSHEQERQQIADRAYHLVTEELTMKRSLAQILRQAFFDPANTAIEHQTLNQGLGNGRFKCQKGGDNRVFTS
ncbi:MAG: hypothetical protein Kow0063_09820 [Anaerolineae bacterium]